MKLIDKDALVAEIEKLKNQIDTNEDGSFCSYTDENTWITLDSLQDFINSIKTINTEDIMEVIVKDGTPDKEYQSPVLEIQKMMRISNCCNVGDKVKILFIKD